MGIFGIIILLVPLVYSVFVFNKLVRLQTLKEEAWSGIDVQLKRRHDLIPNLVVVVEGYATHEKKTLEELTLLRSKSQQQEKVSDIGVTENSISKDLKQIFALAEAYPDLKANESFLELQSTLAAIEDDLQYARRYYNGTVRDLKTLVQTFPSNVIAKVASFQDPDFFELELATERQNPELQFKST